MTRILDLNLFSGAFSGTETLGPANDGTNDWRYAPASIRDFILSNLHREIAGTTDTPTATDNLKTLEFTSTSNQTVTLNHIGIGKSYEVWQTGTGVPQLVAGSGITLASSTPSPSYRPSARYGSLIVKCGSDTTKVIVTGPMA